MKRIITLFTFFIFIFHLSAQHVNYENDSRWFFGLNVGGTWNTTDVKNKTYAGAGFILGKQFNYNYGRKTSFDLRFRYLGGNWYGQDYDTANLTNYNPEYLPSEYAYYKDSLGFTYNNFRTRAHELGLELAIHANGLRERSGWDPYIFGGINLAINQTTSDLVNMDSSFFFDGYYDYDPNLGEAAIKSMRDGDYETAMNSGSELNNWNLDFVPSIGFGIGYQAGPFFSLGIEHKTSFALRNDWDGYDVPQKKWGIFDNDIYHYTSGYLRWNIHGRVNTDVNTDLNTNNNTNNLNNQPCPRPDITMISPQVSSVVVDQQMFNFKAQVLNISSRENVVLRLNGQATSGYFYNQTSNTIEANLLLTEGSNSIELVASNACGQDVQGINITYNTCSQPQINLTQPAYNNLTVDQQRLVLRATILNNATGVSMSLNGVNTNNFFFNASNGSLESNLSLQEGSNTIQIVATNDCGTDTEIITVNYSNCKDPLILFGTPNNTTVNSPTFNYSAEVQNVTSKNDIVVRLNGVNQTFTYNTTSKQLTGVAMLRQGVNTIQITASNPCGTQTQSITVNYEIPCVKPTVTMVTPMSTTQTQSGTQLVKATITGVSSTSQIVLKVNGAIVSGGSYSTSTKVFSQTVNLSEGANNIEVIATNDCGNVAQAVVVNKSTCKLPTISMINPSSINTVAQSGSLAFQATLTGVTSSNQVVLTLNGVNVSSGAGLTNGMYRKSLNLQAGNNVVVLTVTNSCGTTSQSYTISYTPCVAPVIVSMNPASGTQLNTPTVVVSATMQNVQAANNVQLVLNGNAIGGGSYNAQTGVFTQTLTLQAGSNSIQLIATSACGNDQKTISLTYTPPCVLPALTLVNPTSQTVTTDQGSITVQMTASGVSSSGIKLTNNGVTQTGGSYNASTGMYNHRINLTQGVNQIVVTATNSCGTVTETILVNYLPCIQPVVTIVAPINNYQTDQSSVQVQATVLNVSGANEIVLKVNGVVVTGGNYNGTTKLYQNTVMLQEGANTIELTAQTACGSVVKTVVVNYKKPCQLPVITMIDPVNQTMTTDQSMLLMQATITGVTSSGISVSVNGQTQAGGTYTATSGLYSHRLRLSEGANQIVVTATNGCGTVTQSTLVNYIPCAKPTVAILSPINNYVTQNTSVTVQATVMNVTAANQVSMKVNGTLVSGGTYNNTTKQYQNTANLIVGSNVIEITAQTACGEDSKTITVVRQEVQTDNSNEEESNEDNLGTPQTGNPRDMITICHHPPGNPDNTQELTIPLSAWPAHQEHGDVIGPCPEEEDTQEEESNEDNLGTPQTGNPRDMITICHHPPGNPDNTQELTIPLSAWPAHQAHGDILGPCSQTNQGSTGTTETNSENTDEGESNEDNLNGSVPTRPETTSGSTSTTSGSSSTTGTTETETNSEDTNEGTSNENSINVTVPVRGTTTTGTSGESTEGNGTTPSVISTPRTSRPTGRP